MANEIKSSSSKSVDAMTLIERMVEAIEKSSGNKLLLNTPPTFDGTRDAFVIDSWIRSVERYANGQGWDDAKTGKYAINLFKGRADAWYRSIEPPQDQEPHGWVELKRLLIAFFRPEDSVLLARDRMANLKQTGDLPTFINKFMDLKLSIPDMYDSEARDKFVRALSDPLMRSHLRRTRPENLQEAIHDALSFDAGEENRQSVPRRNQQFINDPMDIDLMDDMCAMNDKRRFNNNSKYSNNKYSNNNNNFRYNNNMKYNNNIRGNNGSNNNITCYYCNKHGHIKAYCPVRRQDIKALDDNRQRQNRKDFQ